MGEASAASRVSNSAGEEPAVSGHRLGSCIACGKGFLKSKGSSGYWECRRCASVQRYPLPPRLEALPPVAARKKILTNWAAETKELRLHGLPLTGRLLHIGCGTGEFLLSAKQSGWESFGTETTGAAQLLIGKTGIAGIDPSDLFGSHLPAQSYHLIVAADVLEQCRDPQRFFSSVAQRLTPGGFLLIDTVNVKTFKKARRDESLEEPLVLLSPAAVAELCLEAGLELLESSSYGASSPFAHFSAGKWWDWFWGLHKELKAIDASGERPLSQLAKTENRLSVRQQIDRWFEKYQVWRGKGARVRLICRRFEQATKSCPVCGQRSGDFSRCRGCGLGRQSETAHQRGIQAFSDEGKRPTLRALKQRSWSYWIEKLEHQGWQGRLFDLGCADGALLTLAQSRGWEVWGVEPDTRLAALAPENIRHRILTDPNWNDRFMAGSCEAAVAWDLLDEVEQPVETLSLLFQVLDRNGQLLLRVPNGQYHPLLASWIYRRMQALGFVAPQFRRWIFTPALIKKLVQQAGFEQVRLQSGPPFSEGVEPWKGSTLSNVIALLTFGSVQLGSSLVVTAQKPSHPLRGAVRRSRILHVLPSIEEDALSENALLNALSLPYNRFYVEVLTSKQARPHPLIEKIAHQKGIHLRTLASFLPNGGWWQNYRALRAMMQELQRNPFDVIHTHGRQAGWIGRGAALLNQWRGAAPARLVHTPDAVTKGGWFARSLERYLARRSDALLGQTPQQIHEQVAQGVGHFHQWIALPQASETGVADGQPTDLRKALNLPRNFVEDFLEYRTEALAPVLEHLYDPDPLT